YIYKHTSNYQTLSFSNPRTFFQELNPAFTPRFFALCFFFAAKRAQTSRSIRAILVIVPFGR
ncbi:hypothetical protein, partial [Chryseobacterium sp. YIM B08800]|uniref:hypothetical protein n=1 Tax=Chryseobacterium sp. YIM B08800 TaxID=2984136 RepID=UPI00223FBF7C